MAAALTPSPTPSTSPTPTWSTGPWSPTATASILIDAGFPGSRDDVLDSLRQLGFGVDDLRAILLTHAHIDHFGSAIWFAKTHGTPVYCHAEEVGHSKREYLEQASPVDIAKHIWQPRYLKWSVAITRKGGDDPRRHPEHPGADRGRRRTPARRTDGDPHPRPHRRALLVRGGRRAGQRRRAGHRPPAGTAYRAAAAAEAVQPRPGRLRAQPGRAGDCWTPRCCCPGTARCGGARSARAARRRLRTRVL